MIKHFKIHFLLLLIHLTSAKTDIVTISVGKNQDKATSGNGNISKVNFQTLHLQIREIYFGEFKEERRELNYYKMIKNKLILDFPNEDPKMLRIEEDDYWYVVFKRGYIFNVIAIFFLCFIFWIFVLRIAFGECGGYKTIVRKPSKSARYNVLLTVEVGLAIFVISAVFCNYFMIKDRDYSKIIGKSLVDRNEQQLNYIINKHDNILERGVMEDLKQINKSNMDILYSSSSYERFKIGNYLYKVIPGY